MGTLWLGTVPLTSGVIAKMFETSELGRCSVCVSLASNRLVPRDLIGGYMFDLTGNYDMIWILTALAGFMAAVWPIKESAIEQPA